jgi:hypothetical protein
MSSLIPPGFPSLIVRSRWRCRKQMPTSPWKRDEPMIKTLLALFTVAAVLTIRAFLKLLWLPFHSFGSLFRNRPAAT